MGEGNPGRYAPLCLPAGRMDVVERRVPMASIIALVHEESGTYGISFPDFPGCVSAGASLDEALVRGAATLDFHVRGMVEDGDPLPMMRSYADLKRDPAFRNDAAGAIVTTVPFELPGRAVRIN